MLLLSTSLNIYNTIKKDKKAKGLTKRAKYAIILYMKGIYPEEYFTNPNMDRIKSLKEIWDDIDAYSGEFFEDETNLQEEIDFIVPLPPLNYKNKITKGIVFSQGSEYILKLFPKIKEIFFLGAYTMWSSYSWNSKADFYLSCYKNKAREKYHKKKYNKENIIFVPLQDADYTNEYRISTSFYTPKTIDVLCVSTPMPVKNLPMLAYAIKAYEAKYNKILKTTIVLGRYDVKITDDGIDYSLLPDYERQQLDMVCAILKPASKYITFRSYLDKKELTKVYSSAKCTALTSLIEGKNRSINESLSCDTPVVLFKDHNKWARGGYPVFPKKCGELAEKYTPESFADAIHKIINNPQNYECRKQYLTYNGRKNFIDTLVSYIPYYKKNIPDYNKTKFHENIWVDLACQKNYQLGYLEFLYDRNSVISHVRGINDIKSLMEFYYSRFNIKS